MNNPRTYDVIVVGAGPAGLSAARTTARLGFSTLVIERLAAPGDLGHPCSSIIAPVPHLAHSQGRDSSDLYFRKLDLGIPAHLVLGYPNQRHWLSPEGYDCPEALGGKQDYAAAVIDKRGLLRLLADQAGRAGATLGFGTEVTGLLQEDGRVVGVETSAGECRASMVLSAEGVTRNLCKGVLPAAAGPMRYGFVVGQELEAPAVSADQAGQFVTLGRRYTSAREGFGMVVAPAPGRLSVYFALFADSPNHYTERSANYYIEEYMREDPRVRQLCAGARMLRQTIARTLLAPAPGSVVCDGFMGVGDAITPAGYLGILPALSMGRQAALIAVDALDAGDTSASHLALYEALYRQRILPELEAEAHLLTSLGRMPDADIEAFCHTLDDGVKALPFSAHLHALQWQTVGNLSSGPRSIRPRWQVPGLFNAALSAQAIH